jgi:iron complex outermembrane receptor protein
MELGAGLTARPLEAGRQRHLAAGRAPGCVIDPTLNGKRPTNVPALTLRANGSYRVAAVPGLSLLGTVSYEGDRTVLPDESIALPAWTRLDAGVRYETRMMGVGTTWSLTVNNLTDRRYLKESPYQLATSTSSLGAPRTLRLAVQTAF